MHFWIDKRSQTCGFGRARVAASLSGGGLGFGPHHPRRVRSKSIVTPVQRFQTIECSNSNTTTHNSRTSHINQVSQQHHLHQAQQPQQVHRSQGHHHQTQQHHHHHHQPSYNGQIITTNPYQSGQQNYLQQQQLQQNVCYQPYYSHSIQQQSSQPQQQQQSVLSVPVPVPVSLSHIYGSSSQSLDLEHGNLGIATLTTSPNISSHVRQLSLGGNQIQNSTNQAAIQQQVQQVEQPQIQIVQHQQRQPHQQQQQQQPQPQPESEPFIPAHLKWAICASLALAILFVAGIKYYIDHQDKSLVEFAIFCTISLTLFLFAWVLRLVFRPRDLQLPPSIITENAQTLERLNSSGNNPNLPSDITGITVQNNALIAAPPPPYHIAILLPETSKDMDEETPPPSYDKIVI